jgi:hypothetical protein
MDSIVWPFFGPKTMETFLEKSRFLISWVTKFPCKGINVMLNSTTIFEYICICLPAFAYCLFDMPWCFLQWSSSYLMSNQAALYIITDLTLSLTFIALNTDLQVWKTCIVFPVKSLMIRYRRHEWGTEDMNYDSYLCAVTNLYMLIVGC